MTRNRSMSAAVIIPELPYLDMREAVAWLCRTFGFGKLLRIGNHRAQLSFGEGSLVITQSGPDSNASFSVMSSTATTNVWKRLVRKLSARLQIIPMARGNTRCKIPEVIAGHFRRPLQTLTRKPGVVYFSKNERFEWGMMRGIL